MEKKNKEKITEMIQKAGSEEYETSWNEQGIPYKIKKKSEIKKGRLSRARGARFELKARGNLEAQGWIVDKWTNNVNLEEKKLIKAKRKFNFFSNMKILSIGTGFPDFIAFKKSGENYEIIGVEVKINGILSKIEKEKCKWYLNNQIFSKILIAKKQNEGRAIKIEYINFGEKYGE